MTGSFDSDSCLQFVCCKSSIRTGEPHDDPLAKVPVWAGALTKELEDTIVHYI